MSKNNILKEGLIFDWDGTLFNSVGTIIKSVQLACQELGAPELSDEYVRAGIGLGEKDVCDYLFGKGNVGVVDFWTTYRRIYADFPIQLFPQVQLSLEKLVAQGFVLAVATNKRSSEFERELKKSGLAGCFSAWICADQSRSKPAPDMLIEVARQLGRIPEQFYMVGDTVHDAHAAQSAGCVMLGLDWGVASREELSPVSEVVFSDMQALVDHVGEAELTT